MSRKINNAPVDPVAVDGDETTKNEAAATHEIAAVPEKGFYRAGRYWPREATSVARAEFTDDQWAALEGEPKLTIKPL